MKPPHPARWWSLVAAACILSVPAATAASADPTDLDSTLAAARPLLETQQPATAYDLLAPREAEFGGTPAYDYLLGMAALDSHRPAEALVDLS